MKKDIWQKKRNIGLRPKLHNEGDFEYIRDSERPIYNNIRETWKFLIEKYPPKSKKDIISRLLKKDKRSHIPAVQEIIIYYIFTNSGFNVDSKYAFKNGLTPDFQLKLNGGVYAYIESTKHFPSDKQIARENIFKDICDSINKLNIPNHDIFCSVQRHGTNKLSLKKLEKFFKENIDKTKLIQQSLSYTGDEWHIEFIIIKKPDKPDRSRTMALRWVLQKSERRKEFQSAISDKKNKYRLIRSPYIIAVDDRLLDTEDMFDCLFKLKKGRCIENHQKEIPLSYGEDGGLFRDENNSHLSGIMFFKGVEMTRLQSLECVLWCNPYAKRPLDIRYWPTNSYYFDQKRDSLCFRPGCSIRELMGIGENWIIDEEGDSSDVIEEIIAKLKGGVTFFL